MYVLVLRYRNLGKVRDHVKTPCTTSIIWWCFWFGDCQSFSKGRRCSISAWISLGLCFALWQLAWTVHAERFCQEAVVGGEWVGWSGEATKENMVIFLLWSKTQRRRQQQSELLRKCLFLLSEVLYVGFRRSCLPEGLWTLRFQIHWPSIFLKSLKAWGCHLQVYCMMPE